MTCGTYVEYMLIFPQCSTHILSNQQLYTSTSTQNTCQNPQMIGSPMICLDYIIFYCLCMAQLLCMALISTRVNENSIIVFGKLTLLTHLGETRVKALKPSKLKKEK